MALTLTSNNGAARSVVQGNVVTVFQDVTFDSSYPTGGYALVPSTLGLYEFLYVDAGSATGYVAHYNYSTKKLQVYASSGTEVTNATNLSAVSARVIAVGHGFPTQGQS